MGVVFLFFKVIEFIHRMLLGSEIPVVVTLKDLSNFTIQALAMSIVFGFYIWHSLHKNKVLKFNIKFIGVTSLIFSIIYFLDFINALRYFNYEINFLLVICVGLLSSLSILLGIVLCILKLPKKSNIEI